MFDLKEFIGPAKTKAMSVSVIDKAGQSVASFSAPEGFQLERYVDKRYPNEEFMVSEIDTEITISVLKDDEVFEIYRGVYK